MTLTYENEAALNACRQMPQYAFQRREIKPGDCVINIGCDIDVGLLKHDFAAVSIDVNEWSKSNNCRTVADLIWDCRNPMPIHPVFDVAVLGDILEHFSDEDAVKAIRNAAACLKLWTGLGPVPRLVITCPEDHRSQEEQGEYGEHIPGVPKHHPRPVTIEMIGTWLEAAGMAPASVQRIDYGFCRGWGVLATKQEQPNVAEAIPS